MEVMIFYKIIMANIDMPHFTTLAYRVSYEDS